MKKKHEKKIKQKILLQKHFEKFSWGRVTFLPNGLKQANIFICSVGAGIRIADFSSAIGTVKSTIWKRSCVIDRPPTAKS